MKDFLYLWPDPKGPKEPTLTPAEEIVKLKERFSLLLVISWTSHGLLSLIILCLLAVVAASGVFYAREGDYHWALLAVGVFVMGVTLFINAWRLRLSEL